MTKLELGKYRHFKGGEYEVIGVGRHSETMEELVVYRALYNSPDFGPNAIWIRPIDMFLGKTMFEGKEVNRFERM